MEGISYLSALSDEELRNLEKKQRVESLYTAYFDVVLAACRSIDDSFGLLVV